jgi:hypothetical protein
MEILIEAVRGTGRKYVKGRKILRSANGTFTASKICLCSS